MAALEGHTVLLCEREQNKRECLNRGEVPFYEPGLSEAYKQAVQNGLRTAAVPDAETQKRAHIAFLCTGTPLSGNGLDTSSVRRAAAQLRGLGENAVLAVKSTVPVGFCDSLKTNAMAAYVPEFLSQGTALHDARHPARVVIGTRHERAKRRLSQFYSGKRQFHMRPAEAELAKLAANGFLAARLAYLGEVADVCQAAGMDYSAIAAALGADPRIGSRYLDVGGGFGGSCLPKDSRALLDQSRRMGAELTVLKAAIQANRTHIHRLAELTARRCGGVEGKKIAVFSTRFKEGTEDSRNSPAVEIGQLLMAMGAEVAFGEDVLETANAAHCALVISGHREMSAADPDRVTAVMAHPLVIDAGGKLERRPWEAAGAIYIKFGGICPLPKDEYYVNDW